MSGQQRVNCGGEAPQAATKQSWSTPVLQRIDAKNAEASGGFAHDAKFQIS
jgi:hypothetical protein